MNTPEFFVIDPAWFCVDENGDFTEVIVEQAEGEALGNEILSGDMPEEEE